jgi:hypothetical protein
MDLIAAVQEQFDGFVPRSPDPEVDPALDQLRTLVPAPSPSLCGRRGRCRGFQDERSRELSMTSFCWKGGPTANWPGWPA